METVVVASRNPVKLEAVRLGFCSMFPQKEFIFQEISVPSGVSVQPMSDAETLQGATNRVEEAKLSFPDADYWVGLEGGVAQAADRPEDLVAFAWVVIHSKAQIGKARTGVFLLPASITDLVQQGVELGLADDRVFGTNNSKQNGGAVGLLTGEALTRTTYYAQAVQLALIPFRNPEFYAV